MIGLLIGCVVGWVVGLAVSWRLIQPWMARRIDRHFAADTRAESPAFYRSLDRLVGRLYVLPEKRHNDGSSPAIGVDTPEKSRGES